MADDATASMSPRARFRRPVASRTGPCPTGRAGWHLDPRPVWETVGVTGVDGASREPHAAPTPEVSPMLETRPPTVHSRAAPSVLHVPGPSSCLSRDLRDIARSLAGRLDRDAIQETEERALDEALDATVAAVLPQVVTTLDAELTPRLEALPLHTRLALLDARRRCDLGLD